MLLLKNVRLENGYNRQGDYVKSTDTIIKDLLINAEGKFQEISDTIEANEGWDVFDAEKQLLLPSLRDMHIHIDKTFFSGEWKAAEPFKGRVSRFEEEMTILPKQLHLVESKARAMLNHYIKNGHTFIRTHVNVDPAIHEKNMEHTLKVIDEYKDKLGFEIVAFPQHGLIPNGKDFIETFEKAVSMGVTHVGGIDPGTIDRNIEKSLDTIFDLAIKYDTGIDIHLHEYGHLGRFIISRIMDLQEESNFKNDLTISHAYGLSQLDKEPLDELLSRMSKNGLQITSALPIKYTPITIPIKYICDSGVPVSLGHDSLTDHWSSYGTGDTIQKLNIFVEKFKYVDEFSISQSLKYATGGITPLNEAGEVVWPKVNDDANLILADAVSSAHLIARRCPVTTVVSKGKIIHQEEVELKGAVR